MRVYIEEAGCNRRMLDINTIRTYLETNGYELVNRPEDADKIVVTTCAFKKEEEDESVHRLRHFRNYGSKIVVYGCLADIAKGRYYQEFADLPKVAPRELEKIQQYFPARTTSFSEVAESNVINNRGVSIMRSISRVIESRPAIDHALWHRMTAAGLKKFRDLLFPSATPYYLFICRGCLGKCSYCAIRRAIGSVRSKPIAKVVAEFQRGIENGFREFTILGDDPGSYGFDLGTSLPELLQALFAVAAETEKSESGSDRGQGEIVFHLNEIHPKFLVSYMDKFLEMEPFDSVRSILCPVQSGSDRILGLMQREYTAARVEAAVRNLYTKHPQIAFNTHIIVGYPSETEDEFRATLDLVVRCRSNSVVIFPYDEKDNADSSLLVEKVPKKTVMKRMRTAFRIFEKAGIPAYYRGGYADETLSGRKQMDVGRNLL